MSTSSKKVRDSSLDLVCGGLITYMVLYHAYIWCPATKDFLSTTLDRVFYFFMPWFYFKSGMFHARSKTKEIVISSIKKLIVPFIIYTIIGEIVLWMCALYKEGSIDVVMLLMSSLKCIIVQGSTIGNQPLWFLLSLFFVKVIVTFLENKNIPTFIIIVLACIIARVSSYFGAYINGVFCIPYLTMSTSIGLFFYVMGKIMRIMQFNKVVVIIASLLYTFIFLFIPSQVDVRIGMLKYGSWFAFMVSSLAGIIIINNLSRQKLLQIPYLISIGRNSLSYYCSHWILFTLITTANRDVTNEYHLLAVICIITTLVLPFYAYWITLLKKRFPHHSIYL